VFVFLFVYLEMTRKMDSHSQPNVWEWET